MKILLLIGLIMAIASLFGCAPKPNSWDMAWYKYQPIHVAGSTK